ncbi:MAG: hypothetical protein F6K11_06095 [Leptolyngbya sp. SIO3F4]|nr:hypothetical protein [Leptolyngbya sp. SIO3F4]
MASLLSHTPDIELIEHQTLVKLGQLKDELMTLKTLPIWHTHEQVTQRYATEIEQLVAKHRERKKERDRKRNYYYKTLQGEALTKALNNLKQESQKDSSEQRHLKQKQAQELAPFTESIAQAKEQTQQLKQQYTTLSQKWQVQKQTAYAAEQIGADTPPLTILYQDEILIVVDKPAGLLSVPGRRYHQYDSVLSRLQYQSPDNEFLQVAHRLDQATSGILVLAKSPSIHKNLGQQFAQQQVCKTYEAILSRPIDKTAGVIDLPLWSNPDERPRQSVNIEYGKPSQTHFEVLQQTNEHPRVKFMPYTGRTHQLRVHAAHPQGLNAAILGDLLYGHTDQVKRLHLHAKTLKFMHPITREQLKFDSQVPF